MRVVNASASATFDANGQARATLGPSVYGVRWTITKMVTTTTSVDSATLKVYLNVVSEASIVDTTGSANADVSDDVGIVLETSDKLIFVWELGTPGTVATIVIYGRQEGR